MEYRFVYPILEHKLTWLAVRILATMMFWLPGVRWLFDIPGTTKMMEGMGFTGSAGLVAVLTIAVKLIGSGLIIHGRFAWLGAAMLSVFTVLTIFVVHDFWNKTGAEAFRSTLVAQEHVAVIAGLTAIAIHAHWLRRKAAGQ